MGVDIKKERPRDGARRKNDPLGVRARILEAAYIQLQSQGYAATSVHHIAREAQVTGGALHHHFPTKKVLGIAVIRDRVASALEETWLNPVRTAGNALEAVLEIFESIALELDSQGMVRGCPINNLSLELSFVDPDFRAELALLFDEWRSTISRAMADRPDCDAIAALIVAGFSGAMALAKVEQRGEPLRQCAEQLRKLL